MKSPAVHKKENREIFFGKEMDNGTIRTQYIPFALASNQNCRRYLSDEVLDRIIPPWREYWRGEKVLENVDKPFKAEFEAFFRAERVKYTQQNVPWPSTPLRPTVVSGDESTLGAGTPRQETEMATSPDNMEAGATFYSDQVSPEGSEILDEEPEGKSVDEVDKKVSHAGPPKSHVPIPSDTQFSLKDYSRLVVREMELEQLTRRCETTERAMESCISQMKLALKDASALRRDCTKSLKNARSDLLNYQSAHREM